MQQNDEDWEVCVTRQVAQHNHEVGPNIFKTYHENRRIEDEEVISTVQTLRRSGANRKRILQYILENTVVEPTMRDVHNLLARLQEDDYAFPTVEERVQAFLEDFAQETGNVSRIIIKEVIISYLWSFGC